MTRTPQDPDWLDDALAELAQTTPPPPSDALMSRVVADADSMRPARAPHVPFWREALTMLGGWGAVGGLVAATFTGFGIGLGSSGFDALLPLGEVSFCDSSDGLAAFGWDLGDG